MTDNGDNTEVLQLGRFEWMRHDQNQENYYTMPTMVEFKTTGDKPYMEIKAPCSWSSTVPTVTVPRLKSRPGAPGTTGSSIHGDQGVEKYHQGKRLRQQ